MISGFDTSLGQAPDVSLYPTDPRMVGRDDLRDPHKPPAPVPAKDMSANSMDGEAMSIVIKGTPHC